MKTSFAVPALIWTIGFAVVNYTPLVHSVKGLFATAASEGSSGMYVQGSPTIIARSVDGSQVQVAVADQGGTRIMTLAQYEAQYKTPSTPSDNSRPFSPEIIYFSGMILIYGLAGCNVINEWDRRPVLKLGRYVRTAGPGFAWVDPTIHSTMDDVSLQDEVNTLEIEHLQTHDNVPIALSIAITCRVLDVQQSIVAVDDVWDAMEERAIAAVTHAGGEALLDEIMHKRDELQNKVEKTLKANVSGWGIEIIAVQIKNVKITDESIEKAISMKARASKEADAELVRAKMQEQIAQHLNLAAETYTQDGKWLKGMETMLELCRSAENNTVIVPTQLLSILGGARSV